MQVNDASIVQHLQALLQQVKNVINPSDLLGPLLTLLSNLTEEHRRLQSVIVNLQRKLRPLQTKGVSVKFLPDALMKVQSFIDSAGKLDKAKNVEILENHIDSESKLSINADKIDSHVLTSQKSSHSCHNPSTKDYDFEDFYEITCELLSQCNSLSGVRELRLGFLASATKAGRPDLCKRSEILELFDKRCQEISYRKNQLLKFIENHVKRIAHQV